MKKTITLFASYFIATILFAQNFDWAHGYIGNFSYSNVFIQNSPDNNGGAFTVFNFKDSINPDPSQPNFHIVPNLGYGVLISRFDANGNLLFNKLFDIGHYDHYFIHDIQTLSDGTFYTIATLRNAPYPFDVDPGTGVTNVNSNGLVISHYDSNGNLLTTKKLNIESYKFEFFESALSPTNELLISGAVYYGAHFSEVPAQDTTYANNVRRVFSAKYDTNLDMIWSDYFENDRPLHYTDVKYGVNTQKSNGNSIFVCTIGSTVTLSNTNSYSPTGVYDVLILEYDANGSIINEFLISSAGDDDYPNDITIDSQGNIAIMGFVRDSVDIDLTGAYTNYSKVRNSYLAKFDASFNLKTFLNASMGNTKVKEMEFNSNDELVMAGRLFGTFDFDFSLFGDQFYNLTSAGSSNNYDVFLAKYDTSLNVIYAHNIGNTSNQADVKHMRLNSNDDIFISGELGGGVNDMNFGPLTNNLNTSTNGYGFISKYQLCNTVEVIQNVGVCPGDSYTFPDNHTQNNITAPISRSYRTVAISSCDSLIITNVTINPTYNLTDTDKVCPGDSYTFPDGFIVNNVTSQEIHTSNLQTVLGCDSIVTTTINLNNTYNSVDTSSVCLGGSYTFHDGFTMNNIVGQVSHTSNLQTVELCDSIIQTTVNVNTVDTSVTQNSNVLTANFAGASYQWVDCDNNFSIIAGETNQQFTATNNGNYAVVIDDGVCADTSSCYSVIGLAINENEDLVGTFIYPNPSHGNFIISLNKKEEEVKVEVTDVTGKLILNEVKYNIGKIELNVNNEKGLYYVIVSVKESRKVFKYIKN